MRFYKILVLACFIFTFMACSKKDTSMVSVETARGKLQNAGLVTGIVSDMITHQALSGASVVVKGTNHGTVTNILGQFSIFADADTTLVISNIGYLTQEVPVNGRTSVGVIELFPVEETKK